ncbi:SDR family NAD(P)-dependent oxidoreductase [Frigidibacter sp. ROC022]|uniref:SDR family NAD(P)-dependent oxidoreductase n=1 Tax=Frigidibacter sp. ROC022 TaxID=2971796 RepID=UPI00215A9F96|nr:SDR family oxidoreductase [Frigidibacter sp. ROC022]MCR8725946.1 SDR family oxidoreductase [Frigidibacter sp. ROC022]
MSFSISGKTAIVTGAAGGVGLAIARHFVAQGANVVFSDEDEAALEEAIGTAGDTDADAKGEGAHTRAFSADLRSKLSIANLLSSTIDAFDRVDILVNAAREVVRSEALDPDQDMVMPMLEANLMPALRLSQAVAKRMIGQAEREGRTEGTIGTIVNLSSISAQRTFKGMMGYSVASAALDQLTRSLAVALAPNRVRVNGLAFASVLSNALGVAMREQEGLREAVIAATPAGRIANPTEIAEAVHFLASDASDFVVGQVLVADGGRSLLDTVRVVHS